tara:strand:+ start:1278 stop:1613 length:336 start_codon:yes stop_codon:yes gene_type:complete
MTQKRKVGPGGGDFALNPNRFSGGGGGKSIVTGKKSTVSEKTRGPQKKMTKKRLEDATEKIKDDAGRTRQARWRKANLPAYKYNEFMEQPYEQLQLKKMRAAVAKVEREKK